MRLGRLLPALCLIAFVGLSKAQTFNVFAAASLKESATEMARAFEKRYPNFRVALNFGGSQQLVAQIKQGAPVDVLLSAGMESLKSLTYDKSSLRIFATNRLALIVPTGSTKVKSLSTLNLGLSLIFADKHVPVGHYTESMLANAAKDYGSDWLVQVQRGVVSHEQDVRAVLTKLSLGEADAGFVYVTDVPAAKGKVRIIPIPDKYNVVAEYPVVRFAGSSNADLAKDFIRFLFEKEAQKALVNHGFGSPIVPGGVVQLSIFGKKLLLDGKHLSKLPVKSFSASEHGVMRQFTGHEITQLIGDPVIERLKRSKTSSNGSGNSMKVTAGDGYTQTVNVLDVLKDGIYLVDSAHGNYQLILPAKPPKFWVHWVREIIVH